MVFINELFPNPMGVDTAGEFIELYNSDKVAMGLTGWSLKTEKGKIFSLTGRMIPANGYLVLKHADTKLTLRNTDGGISLYNAQGVLVDNASFVASAPEGKSFSRVNYLMEDVQHFAFVDPTPGAANKKIENTIASHEYLAGISLTQALAPANFFTMLAGTAFLLIGLILYSIDSHEDLSKLFFQGDQEVR